MKSQIVVTLSLVIALFSFSSTFAQNGTIRGTVFDGETGETIPFAKVFVENTDYKAITDLDGKYNINLPAGQYNLLIRVVGKDSSRLENVQVNSGDITMAENVSVFEKTLGKVVVTHEVKYNTTGMMDKMVKSATNQIDPISSEKMRDIGASDATDAIKTVPGVTVAGGKYVYIRGVGDRYNKTMLNGVSIPGLDPDKNTIQMDIFPTGIISNMVVSKTFIAELPADFSGGLIDINTRSFQDKRVRSVSVGVGYNPLFHFNSEYLTYQGGKTDFLGFDDGTRKIPATTNIPFFSDAVGNPDSEDGQRYQEILKSFNTTLAAQRQMSLMDVSLGTTFGNQFKLKKKENTKIGYNVVIGYKNKTEFYEDAQFSRYGLAADPNVLEMETRELQVGDSGVNNVLLSGLASVAIKTLQSKISFSVMRLQNGESKAGIFDYYNSDQGAIFEGFQHNLEYSERSLTNALISGKHDFREAGWMVEWRLSPTLSQIEDPDIRFTRYEDRDGSLYISTEAGFPERIWRKLSEKSLAGVLHLTRDYRLFDNNAKFKFGGGYTYKIRDFQIRKFALNIRNIPLTGDPNELFAEENIWPYNGDPTSGTTYEADFFPSNPNKFNANVSNAAAYVSTEISPAKKFKAIIGARLEYYTQRYTGQDQLGTNVLNNDNVLQNLGIYPSLNLVYSANEKQNFRFSYGKTVARPSMKELSYAEIFDPITGRTFIGGLFRDENQSTGEVYWDGQLSVTDIHNLDLRWEIFPKRGQKISVSAFYKYFQNPIEIVQFATQSGAFQPRNVGDGQVFGGEIEIRQNFGFISKKMENFGISGNFTLTTSRIKLSPTEYDSRVNNARVGQTVGEYRDMAGQAPFLINAGLFYTGGEKGFLKAFRMGLYYNVQGSTLQYVGIVDRPDIYSNPFHSLNLTISKVFGEKENYRLSFKASNLLNDYKESVFRSFESSDLYFQRLGTGPTFSLKFGLNF